MTDQGGADFGLLAARPHVWLIAAALMLAGCAGGPVTREAAAPVTPAVAPSQGFTQTGVVNIAYSEFQNSPFPYHGLIPDKDRPFLDVNDKGRLGHSSRGGVYWEDETYSDRHVLLASGPDFDPRRGGDLVLFFHGNASTLARDVVDRQQTPQQLVASGLNGALVAPQMAVDAQDSSAGRFWQPGALAAFLDETDSHLAKLYPGTSRATFRNMPVVIVAYSGGYLPTAFALAQGGATNRVRGVVLLDALYGEEDKFADWIAREHSGAFFVSAYSNSTRSENIAFRQRLIDLGLPVQDRMPERLGPGTIAFIDSGDVAHLDFMSNAWTSQPLRDVLARVEQ